MRKLLQATRRFHEVSQAELAHAVGVSQKSVSNWEHELATPTLKQARIIADLFGVEAELLFPELYPEGAGKCL